MEVAIGQEGTQSAWHDVVVHRDDVYIEDFEVFARYIALSVP